MGIAMAAPSTASRPTAASASLRPHTWHRMQLLTFAAHVESAAAAALLHCLQELHAPIRDVDDEEEGSDGEPKTSVCQAVFRSAAGTAQARRRHARAVGTNANTPLHARGTSKRNNVGQDWRQQCMMAPQCPQRSFHPRALLVAPCHAVAAICAPASVPVC